MKEDDNPDRSGWNEERLKESVHESIPTL